MSKPRQWDLVLAGPYAGQTRVLNGRKFVDGVFSVVGTPEAVRGLVTYMGRSYQAYLSGSPELEAAQARDAASAAQEDSDGQRDTEGDVQPEAGADSVDSVVQSAGPGPEAVSANDGAGAVDDAAGPAGSVPDRDGHADAGVPAAEAGSDGAVTASEDVTGNLEKSIMALDPGVEDHWTKAGAPAMSAIETAYGSTGITRKDVQAAVPDWDRDKAKARAKEMQDLAELTA